MIGFLFKKFLSFSFTTRLTLSLGAGCALAWAMPPVGAFPLLFICLPLLMHFNAEAKTPRQSFLTGWIFGFGYFSMTLYWLDTAFGMFFSAHEWLKPIFLFLIPGYIALYYGLACLIAWRWRNDRLPYILIFVVAMFWAEYLRGDFVTHFPWSLLGYAWHRLLPVLQITSVIGIAGLTLLSLLWSTFFLAPMRMRVLLLISFFCVAGWGWNRLQTQDALRPVTVRLVQPNIAQHDKDRPEKEQETFTRLQTLTRSPAEKIDIVVWPETVIDVFTAEQKERLNDIPALLPPGSRNIILGVNRPDEMGQLRNSVLVLDQSGQTIATHDKFILAPWGEGIPYPGLVRYTPLHAMIDETSMMVAGDGPKTLRLPNGLSFSPIICFESTFSGSMTVAGERPDALLFITNDAWSAGTDGPQQHFGFARLRAIEEGLPIIRAANNGFSAIIDPHGRIEKALPEDTAGVLDGQIPMALPPTFFSLYKNMPALLFSLLLLLGAACFRRKEKSK